MKLIGCPGGCGETYRIPPDKYCEHCGQYLEDMMGATADVSPAAREEVPIFQPGSITLTIPWDCLASSNLRKGLDRKSWRAYKQARETTHLQAVLQVDPRPRFPTASVRITVAFYEPDRRVRDTSNLLKCLLDGLEGVAYTTDAQVVAGKWEDMGVDPDNPRAEVVVVSDGYEDIKHPNTRRTA